MTDRPRTPSSAATEAWAPLASVSAFVAVDDRKLPSSGHNPPYWAGVVRVNDTLLDPYRRLAPGATVPPGSIAVEAHTNLEGSVEHTYAMEKRAPGFDPGWGDWEYVVLGPDGGVEARGVLGLCARCHAEAPHDHLFGPRLSARRHIQSDASSVEGRTDHEVDTAIAPDENAAPAGSKTERPRKKDKRRKLGPKNADGAQGGSAPRTRIFFSGVEDNPKPGSKYQRAWLSKRFKSKRVKGQAVVREPSC